MNKVIFNQKKKEEFVHYLWTLDFLFIYSYFRCKFWPNVLLNLIFESRNYTMQQTKMEEKLYLDL
jgi:hypothetical protein